MWVFYYLVCYEEPGILKTLKQFIPMFLKLYCFFFLMIVHCFSVRAGFLTCIFKYTYIRTCEHKNKGFILKAVYQGANEG